MTINFNGGIHEVILFKDGNRYDKSNFPEFFNSIASVSARVGNESLGTIEVQITPSLKDAFKILASGLLGIGMTQKGQKPLSTTTENSSKSVKAKTLDSLVSSPKTSNKSFSDLSESIYPVLAVRFLYPGQTDNDGGEASTDWYGGICNVPDINMSETEITITMKAASSAILGSKMIATARFENESIYDSVKKLADPLGLVITFDGDDTQTEPLLKKLTYTGISSEPPMVTIKSMLLSADCSFALINGNGKNPQNEIRIKSRKSINEGKIDFTFVLYRQIDPANNVIPIYALSLNSNGALFLPGGAFGSSQTGVDSSEKKVVTLDVSDSSNKTKALTGNSGGMGRVPGSSGTQFGMTNGITNVPPDMSISGSNDPILQNGTRSNKSEIEARALTDGSLGLSYQITVPGLPRLKAMRLAQVIIEDNVPGISGPGQIYFITHRTGPDGWVSELDFRRQPALVDGVSVDPRKTEPTARPTSGTQKKTITIPNF